MIIVFTFLATPVFARTRPPPLPPEAATGTAASLKELYCIDATPKEILVEKNYWRKSIEHKYAQGEPVAVIIFPPEKVTFTKTIPPQEKAAIEEQKEKIAKIQKQIDEGKRMIAFSYATAEKPSVYGISQQRMIGILRYLTINKNATENNINRIITQVPMENFSTVHAKVPDAVYFYPFDCITS